MRPNYNNYKNIYKQSLVYIFLAGGVLYYLLSLEPHICSKLQNIFLWFSFILLFTVFDTLGWTWIVKKLNLEYQTGNPFRDEMQKDAMASYRIMQLMFMVVLLVRSPLLIVGGFIFSWQFLVCDFLFYPTSLEQLPNYKINWFAGWSLPALILSSNGTNTLTQFIILTIIGTLVPIIGFILL